MEGTAPVTAWLIEARGRWEATGHGCGEANGVGESFAVGGGWPWGLGRKGHFCNRDRNLLKAL